MEMATRYDDRRFLFRHHDGLQGTRRWHGFRCHSYHPTYHSPGIAICKNKAGYLCRFFGLFYVFARRVSVFGDCAVNPNPTAEQLSEIAISSAESSRRFGIEPRIAMLSYSSGASGEGEDVDKVREATEIVKRKRPDLKVEGPIQYDAAVDPFVGQSKTSQFRGSRAGKCAHFSRSKHRQQYIQSRAARNRCAGYWSHVAGTQQTG